MLVTVLVKLTQIPPDVMLCVTRSHFQFFMHFPVVSFLASVNLPHQIFYNQVSNWKLLLINILMEIGAFVTVLEW